MGVMERKDRFTAARCRMVQTQIADRGVGRSARVERPCGLFRATLSFPKNCGLTLIRIIRCPSATVKPFRSLIWLGLMTSLLELQGNEKILEIGTGSGYQAAVLGALAAEVHSVERIIELAAAAQEKLAALHFDNVTAHVGDGSLGWPAAAPYDGILVTAGAPAFPLWLERAAQGRRPPGNSGGRTPASNPAGLDEKGGYFG